MCANAWEAYLGLVVLSGGGRSQVGCINDVLKQASTSCGVTPRFEGGCPLPLDPSLVEAFLSEHDKTVTERAPKSFPAFACVGVFACWNFLFCAGWSDAPVDLFFSKSLDLTEKPVIDQLWETVNLIFNVETLAL